MNICLFLTKRMLVIQQRVLCAIKVSRFDIAWLVKVKFAVSICTGSRFQRWKLYRNIRFWWYILTSSESELGQGHYYIVVIHLSNSLKGNLHQVNEFPRDVSDIDWISKTTKETQQLYRQYQLHAISCLT